MIERIRNPKQLGAHLKRLRKQTGLSQSDLSSITGITQAQISKIENGSSGTRVDTLFKILSVLKLDVELTHRVHKESSKLYKQAEVNSDEKYKIAVLVSSYKKPTTQVSKMKNRKLLHDTEVKKNDAFSHKQIDEKDW